MIDPNVLENDPERVRESFRRRNESAETLHDVERWLARSERRRELISERDRLRADRNRISKEIGQLYRDGRGDEAEEKKAEVSRGNERTKVIEEELETVETERDQLGLTFPNLLQEQVPAGTSEEDNVVVRTWGEPRTDGEGIAHVEIGEALGIVDLDRSTKLAGARFSILSGAGARLERALINFFLDVHTAEHGYTEVMVPYIVHDHALVGTGQLPKFGADMFKLEGELNGSPAYLIPTAEVPVTNIHRDEILEEADLPKTFAAFTPCFRAEAGSAGRDVRGLIRQHQFHKVELVWLTTPERAEEDHLTLLAHAESMLQRLKLPYRVVKLCGGDTSFSASICYDLEVWLPSQQQYREISSVSWFTDFQARRMNLRYRPETEGSKKAKTRFAHTLNGSGLAVGRTLVAILENFRQADGSVIVPEPLRPYMAGMDVLKPNG